MADFVPSSNNTGFSQGEFKQMLKKMEADYLALLDAPGLHPRWREIARQHIEEGTMAAVRSVFEPTT